MKDISQDASQNTPSVGSIRFLTGPCAGSFFPLSKPTLTIGRDASNDIIVRNDAFIANFHARLLWMQGLWYIEKHPQASSLIVNQQPVQNVPLQSGAIIGLGEGSSFLFSENNTPADMAANNGMFAQNITTSPPQLSSTFLANLAQSPDKTQIASLSAIGIPSLLVSSNSSNYQKTFPLDKPTINVGRDTTNDIVINERIISSQHFQIVRQGNQFVLVHPHPDRQKTLNGLFYQGRKIRGDEAFRKTLERNDIFRIGDENGSFITLAYNDGGKENQEELPLVHPIKLTEAEISIGRNPANTVILSHPQVSGNHAKLIREGGTYRIHDLGSTNHVYVNAQLVTNHLLKMGDEIHIGPFRLVYEGSQLTQYDESNYIRIDARNLKKYGNNNVTLLDNISLSIPPRTLVAVVGGSGAGKSTLLNALSGLRQANAGSVLYNGQDYYRNLAAFSGQIGYVPQDDIVHRDLTVERALYYAARMRLPDDFTDEQIQQRINEVLDDVELTPRRGLLIKRLSGGQRKRVSIALELLSNPSLFFLDEPTSGLDPGLDRKMMFLLRRLADKGHTVILVTHATNNITMCDYVCFMAQGGRLAYFGPPDKAKAFFNKDDFSEIYSALESTDENTNVPEEAELRFKTSPDYQEYVARGLKDGIAVANGGSSLPGVRGVKEGSVGHERVKTMTQLRPKKGNHLKQFALLVTRNAELLRNNVPNLLVLLLQAPLTTLVLMLLVYFEIGPNMFDPNKIAQCRSQIFVGTTSLPVLGEGIDPAKEPIIHCDKVVHFLSYNTQGGTQYASQHGGVKTALQNFITPGNSPDVQRVIFLIVLFAVLFSCINAAREIIKEMAIYQRERAVNLGIAPYMFSKIAILGLLALLQSASILVVVEIFEPLHQGVFLPVLLENYITLSLVAICGVLLGLVISAVSPNEDTANNLLAPVIITQVMFAGSVLPLKDPLTLIAAALFPTRWTIVAVGSSLGLHSDQIDNGKLFGNDPAYHGTLFSIYNQADAMHRILLAWGALGITIVVLAFLVAIMLKRKDART